MTTASPRVFLRLRPPLEIELQERRRRHLEVVNRTTVTTYDGQEFSCLGVFDEGISSDSMYRESCAALPQHLLEGYHCTVLTYGATQSGKSQTVKDLTRPLIGDIFDALSNNVHLHECCIRCSVVEVYLERLRDLLHEPSTVQLQSGRMSGCATVACLSAEDVLNIIDRARSVQTISATIPNEKSNRSTAIVQLTFHQTLQDGTTVESRLHIIDLLGCELVQPMNESLEAVQVSISLKALHKQIRHLAFGKAPIPLSDIPIVAQLLSYSFSSTNLSLFLTTSPYAQGSESLFKFGFDCQRVRMTLKCHRRPANHNLLWRRLTKSLVLECERSGLVDDAKVKSLIQRVKDDDVISFDETANTGGQNHDRILIEFEKAKSERDQLCADLAILQAQSLAVTNQNQKMKQEIDRLQAELRSSQFQKYQVEETLRISQFREAEAVVFLRQLRRFYFRLLQKTASEGSPDHLTMQLVDMDQFMVKSGLLEEAEVGGDVSTDSRPSRQSLERSIEECEQAQREAQKPPETHPGSDISVPIMLMDDQPPLPESVTQREDPGKVEARQRLYKTPAGRYIAMRERILEEEMTQLSEVNGHLRIKLREAMANLDAVLAQGGITASMDKMRIGQEIHALKEQLGRKNNDLKAVIWKMNELHMVGQSLQTKVQTKDHRVAQLEQSLVDLRQKLALTIDDRKSLESSLQLSISHLKNQLQSLVVPVWQLSSDGKANSIPLQGRITVPFGNVSIDQHDNTSLGEPGEWADSSLSCEDKFTQTDTASVRCISSQTKESDYVVDRSNTRSIEVQTDDVIDDMLDIHGITESNVESLMFMISPQSVEMPKMKISALNSKPPATRTVQTNASGSSGVFSTPLTIDSTHDAQSKTRLSRNRADRNANDLLIPNDILEDEKVDFTSKIYGSYLACTYELSQPWSFPMSDRNDLVSAWATQQGYSGEATQESVHSQSLTGGIFESPSRLGMCVDMTKEAQSTVLDTFERFQSNRIISLDSPIETSDHVRRFNLNHHNDQTLNSTETVKFLSADDRERYSPRQHQKQATDHVDVDLGNLTGTIVRSLSLQQEQAQSEGHVVVPYDNNKRRIESALKLHQSDERKTPIDRDVGRGQGMIRPTKSEGSPKKSVKTNRNLNSFLDRLQNQAKKRIEDDEKTETPEFMKLFKKIGGKNKNETVVETSGAVASRDAQRTYFAQIKVGHQKVVDPRQMEAPSKSWKPIKKKSKIDSESSDDDSFARNFMRGLAAPESKSDPDMSDCMVPDSESDHDVCLRDVGQATVDGQPPAANHAATSSSDDDEPSAIMFDAMTIEGPNKSLIMLSDNEGLVAPTEQSNVAHPHTDSNTMPRGKTSPEYTLGVVRQESRNEAPYYGEKSGFVKTQSESSSSSNDCSVPMQRMSPLATSFVKKAQDDSSSSDDSSDESNIQLRPNRLSTTTTNQKSLSKVSYSSSSDSSGTRNRADTLQAVTPHVKDSEIHASLNSTDDSKTPAVSQQKLSMSRKDSSSSDDSSTTSARDKPFLIQNTTKNYASDDSSDDSESDSDGHKRSSKSNCMKNDVVNQIKGSGKTASSNRSSSDDTSDSDSSYGWKIAKKSVVTTAAQLNKSKEGKNSFEKDKMNGFGLNKVKDQVSSSDESSLSRKEQEKTTQTMQQTKINTSRTAFSSHEKSCSSDDDTRLPVPCSKNASSSSSEDSNSSSHSTKDEDNGVGDLKKEPNKSVQTEVPDFAARIKQAAAKAKNKKHIEGRKSEFVIKDGKIVRINDGKGKTEDQKLAKSPGLTDTSPRRRPRNRSIVNHKKFEIKEGKLVRKQQEKPGAKKAAFKIVGGKLVKTEEASMSSEDSDGTEKAGCSKS